MEKTTSSKTVQLDSDPSQTTVNRRIADFKLARGACLVRVAKNRPSLLQQFTTEETLVLGMRNVKLRYLTASGTDEDFQPAVAKTVIPPTWSVDD